MTTLQIYSIHDGMLNTWIQFSSINLVTLMHMN